jgi:hypothetical protein
MLAIAYHFHVRPRHHEHFRHAWQSAQETLHQCIGLAAHRLREPFAQRHDAFMLLLAWDSQASFERFTRTWVGVWVINGMGLAREAFAAPFIRMEVGSEESGCSRLKAKSVPEQGRERE